MKQMNENHSKKLKEKIQETGDCKCLLFVIMQGKHIAQNKFSPKLPKKYVKLLTPSPLKTSAVLNKISLIIWGTIYEEAECIANTFHFRNF